MRVAHFYPWVYLTSGVERVILEICKRSRHRHTVFTNHFDRGNTYPEFCDLDVVELGKVSVKRSMGAVMSAAARIAFQKMKLDSFDVLLVHSEGLGDLALNRRVKLPVVCICYTPLRPVFDAHYRQRVLCRFKWMKRLLFHAFSAGFKVVDQRMWSRYRYIVFISAEAAKRSQDGGLLRDKHGKYEVLHPGIDWEAQKPTWRYEPYFLLPGRIMWTKNIETAIQAFLRFKSNCPRQASFRLVIAGQVDLKSQPYIGELRGMTAGRDDVDFVVSPSDNTLRHLYAKCYAVLFPAFNEDWGIVPLEANAYGKPIIAVNKGGPLESQVDGETGYLVDPTREAFAAAMTSLAEDEDLVRRMGVAGRKNAFKYDWSHFVSRLDQVLEEIVAGRRL